MFMRLLEKYAYALMRIIVGFLFLWHGSQKLFNIPAFNYPMPAFIHYVGGSIEFFGGLLVMVGLGTRWAAFIASGEMAVAYWMGHGTKAFLPLINQGEMAVLYCFIFLTISAAGPGIWSIDNLIEIRKIKRTQ